MAEYMYGVRKDGCFSAGVAGIIVGGVGAGECDRSGRLAVAIV